MKSRVFAFGFVGYLFILILALELKAQTQENSHPTNIIDAGQSIAADSVTKIERVEWTGVHLLGLRVFGHWRPVDKGTSFLGLYLGSNTPHFRLNEENKTIFRGLGRESGFMQLLFPTSHTRRNIRDFIITNDDAFGCLQTFDKQIGTGEKIYMVSKASSLIGEAMFYSGLFFGAVTSNIDLMKKISIPGLSLFIVGTVGRFIGIMVEEKAFVFLDDAVEKYNTTHFNRIGSFY